MRIKILAGIYVLIVAVIVFLADNPGTRPLLGFVQRIPYGDKIGHLLVMGVLSFVLNLALGAKRKRLFGVNLPLGTVVVLLAVTIEEVSQIYVLGRSFDIFDLVFDYIGIVAFGEFARLLTKHSASE